MPNRIGIWMDHTNAHIMEFTSDPITTVIISSKFTHREKEHSLGKSGLVEAWCDVHHKKTG